MWASNILHEYVWLLLNLMLFGPSSHACFPFYFNFYPQYDQQHHYVNDVLISTHKKDKLIMVYHHERKENNQWALWPRHSNLKKTNLEAVTFPCTIWTTVRKILDSENEGWKKWTILPTMKYNVFLQGSKLLNKYLTELKKGWLYLFVLLEGKKCWCTKKE